MRPLPPSRLPQPTPQTRLARFTDVCASRDAHALIALVTMFGCGMIVGWMSALFAVSVQ